jgi:hypothetical protein
VERRRHWWNGKWGKLARRDIYLRTDADVWWVEVREGGAEGSSRQWEFADEDQALDVVRALLARDDDWREIGIPPGDSGV